MTAQHSYSRKYIIFASTTLIKAAASRRETIFYGLVKFNLFIYSVSVILLISQLALGMLPTNTFSRHGRMLTKAVLKMNSDLDLLFFFCQNMGGAAPF